MILEEIDKGESSGHPFRGNQYTRGVGGQGKRTAETGSPSHPINCGKDLDKAATLLSQGKSVRLDDKRQASMLLSKMQAMAQQMKKDGQKAKDFDLCRITVPGTNLFCQQSKGIPRAKMPQLKGKPTPGSPASKKRKDKKGEVSVEGDFIRELHKRGIKVTEMEVPASQLKATQSQLNGVKVGGMMRAIESGKMDTKVPIFVTRDGYVIDGHHRWAAMVGEGLRHRRMTMPVRVLDMDIGQAIDLTNQFAKTMGIAQQGVGVMTGPMAKEDLDKGEAAGHTYHGNQYDGKHIGGGKGGAMIKPKDYAYKDFASISRFHRADGTAMTRTEAGDTMEALAVQHPMIKKALTKRFGGAPKAAVGSLAHVRRQGDWDIEAGNYAIECKSAHAGSSSQKATMKKSEMAKKDKAIKKAKKKAATMVLVWEPKGKNGTGTIHAFALDGIVQGTLRKFEPLGSFAVSSSQFKAANEAVRSSAGVSKAVTTEDDIVGAIAIYEREDGSIECFMEPPDYQENVSKEDSMDDETVGSLVEKWAEEDDLSDDQEPTAMEGEIVKIDEDQRLIFGWAYIAADQEGNVIVDKQGDFFDDESEVEAMAYDYVLNSRLGDVMHTEVQKSRLVESMVFTPEKLVKMGLEPDALPTGWWVGLHVEDDTAWAGVKEGRYSMFSIGGRGVRTPVE